MTMYRVNSGKYRHIIAFQENRGVPDPYGEITNDPTNWITIYTTRAGIYPISGKEVLTKDFVNSELTHRIHMRYDPTIVIDSHMRVVFNDRIFQIIAPPINFQEKNVELQLLCREVV